MGRRKAFLHIGLPCSGDAFPDALGCADLRRPAISAEEMFRAAIEVRRDHRVWGYERREVEGVWAEICRRAQKGRDDVVFGQDLLAACTPAQIALLLDTLAGFEIHVVVTARDPATQLVAAWAGSVESGRSVSFARFCRRVMDPALEHEQARRFWAGQDLAAVLARWSDAVGGPHRVHVVVLPPALGPGSAPDPTAMAVLRQVNRAVDGRMPARAHRTVVRRYLADGTGGVAAPAIPDELHATLHDLGERWRKQLADGGYDVHGDSADLLPAATAPGAVPPDDVPAEERLSAATDVLATVLVEVARLREHNEALEQRNAKLEKKRQKLKRRLREAG